MHFDEASSVLTHSADNGTYLRDTTLAIDKRAQILMLPVSARRQLNDLPDEYWTKLTIEFYRDSTDAVFKMLVE